MGVAADRQDQHGAVLRRLADVVDLASARDRAFAAALLRSFLDRADVVLPALRDAVVTQDGARVELLAHELKGAALNLGADALGARCEQLEAVGRSRLLTGAAGSLEQVDRELRAVAPVLTDLAEELASACGRPVRAEDLPFTAR